MLDNVLQEIMEKYPIERENEFAKNILAETIRHEVPEIFKSYFPERSDLIWNASPGQGNWAQAPWIAILNPLVTESPQSGYYPVYLFNYSLSEVYLSFNQGVTKLREEFPSDKARNILTHRSDVIRSRLSGDIYNKFDYEPLDLENKGPATLLAWYEIGHIFGKKYIKGEIPPTNTLIDDLREMLHLYDLAIARGGWTEFDPVDQQDLGQDEAQISLEEKRKVRLHRVIERNPRLARKAKEIHGYKCQACGMDFELFYGEIGKEYIEAHHRTPISQLPLDGTVMLSPKDDFIVLCSNCHSMIHRNGAPQDLEDFRRLINMKK